MPMLECADCHARVREAGGEEQEEQEEQHCPRCGGRLLGPPDFLGRRWVVRAIYGAVGTLLVLAIVIRGSGYGLAVMNQVLGPHAARATEAKRAQQLEEMLHDAERDLPPYPGSARLLVRTAPNRVDTAPIVDVCWQAGAPLADVVVYYRRTLPALSWQLRGETAPGNRANRQLAAERGQIRLLIHAPDDGAVLGLACPPETTYAVSLTAFSPTRS